MKQQRLLGVLLGAILAGIAAPAVADDDNGSGNTVIFNSIPSPQPPNVASEGPEAYAFAEIGDAVVFPTVTGGTLTQVTVMMSSWGCTSGNWYTSGTCLTSRNATFAQPVTMNVYALDDTASPAKAGALLGTVTQTFQIPYRPSTDTVHCPNGNGQQWYNPADGQCYHGLAARLRSISAARTSKFRPTRP